MRIRIQDLANHRYEIYSVIDVHLDGRTYIIRFQFTLGYEVKCGEIKVSDRYQPKIDQLFCAGYAEFTAAEITIDKPW